MSVAPYNPLDKRNIGASVAEALLARDAVQLSELATFRGAGIYAIYYLGKFPAYRPIADRNKNPIFEAPIYVGKAVPAGSRKGDRNSIENDPSTSTSTAIFRRLIEHRESLEQTSNLDAKDFYCRYLSVDDIWIPLGESLLINKFKPVWNSIVDGFGNHDPGKGRYAGVRPRWDVIHPGRPWAERCAARNESSAQILRDVKEYLRSHPFPLSPHFYAMQERAGYDS